MANLYLVLDDNGRVRGCQTTKGTIDDERYVLVDAETYNQFGRLSPYEYMTIEGKGFTVHPDPRPEIKVTCPATKKVGEIISITLDQVSLGREEKTISKDVEELIEYETPDGRIGLIKASFRNGRATCAFTPDKSGYYHFRGNNNYKPEAETTIAVYEE